MSTYVDERLFEELAGKEVSEVVLPPYCQFLEENKCYRVKSWGGVYEVKPEEKAIYGIDGTREAHEYFYVFLVNYLIGDKQGVTGEEWISEKDLVGGTTFFRGPHEIPTGLISKKYGNDLDALRSKCESLGGQPLDMADFSYSFQVIGSLRIALLYWLGDDDFPAEAKLLVDSSSTSLALDVIYAMLCDACVRIGQD